jgi:hypothetical protein
MPVSSVAKQCFAPVSYNTVLTTAFSRYAHPEAVAQFFAHHQNSPFMQIKTKAYFSHKS